MNCSKLDTCRKIEMLQGKDLPEDILAKFIRHVCENCSGKSVAGNA